MTATLRQVLPGLGAAGLVAAVGWWLGGIAPVIGAAVFALLLGLVLATVARMPGAIRPGLEFTLKRLLRVAIVLFGAGLSVLEVVTLGAASLAIIVIAIVLAIGLTWSFGRWLRAPPRLVSLIGVGTAICGATAIITVGPIIKAREDETAFAVTTIFLFNMLAVVVYPPLGHALALTDSAFGVWAGTAIHDTSSVLAASFTFSDAAGQAATVVKLTRTLMLVPLALVIGVAQSARARRGGAAGTPVRLAGIFPWFILWFALAALLNTAGVITPGATRLASLAGKVLIVMVMAAVGLGADLRQMRRLGGRPVLIGLFASILIALSSILLIGRLLP